MIVLFRNMRMVVGVFLATIFWSSCAHPDPDVIRVAAASSMRNPLDSISVLFEQSTGTDIEIVYGASGSLYQQISNGAPFDLFLSASKGYIDQLGEKVDTSSALLLGRLASIGYDPCIAGRVALPNGEVAPYGIEAQRYIDHLVCEPVPELIQAKNAAHVVQLYDAGAITCGVTAFSLLMNRPLTERVVVLPARFNVEHHAAFLQGGKVEAQRLYEVLFSERARLIWESGGYSFL